MALRSMSVAAFFLVCAFAPAQQLFKGRFYNGENRINLYLDLYEETVEIPGYSFLGKTNGYMGGNIYGLWMLTSHKISGNTATLRFSNDLGADSQTIVLTMLPDSTFSYQAVDGNAIRKTAGRKLVKVPSEMVFKRR